METKEHGIIVARGCLYDKWAQFIYLFRQGAALELGSGH